MAWQLTPDIAAFDDAAGAFLAAQPTRHTLLLSVPAVLRERGRFAFGDEPPRFGWYRGADGRVGAALVQTPPHPALLSAVPGDAVDPLLSALLGEGWRLSGVNAPAVTADAVTAAWCAATGASSTIRTRHRLYLLGSLVGPDPAPPGAARPATTADLDLATGWYTGFAAEVGDPVLNAQRVVGDRIENGTLLLWEIDGVPVSMAGISVLLEGGGTRVGPVYTPKGLRSRGYAAAVTAAVCRLAFSRGAREVSLFTDLANPTSNALYQRLGFRPIEDFVAIDFVE